jgi:putative DNA methylase
LECPVEQRNSASMTVTRRKLIEVSLPLEAINREAAREKSIRHGHPSTLHLWWSRKPLATARAVLFAQLVDDPSAHPEEFPTESDQKQERERLHNLIERLVLWENSRDTRLLAEAHAEILKSTGGNPPPILDPFAGGGTIPLEAQRLGLESHASDLNPVAVLINKALIEIPPKFRDSMPVFPGLAESQIRSWDAAEGLAADVRAYGGWIRDEAEKRIGHLYPKATLPDGSMAPVIAWIWARTVTCPNPQCRIELPLVRSWWLGKKKGRQAYVIPKVLDGKVEFEIGQGVGGGPTPETDGTVGRTGATCIGCGAAVGLNYIRAEGRAGRFRAQLMATVAEGNGQRMYLPPTSEHRAAAGVSAPADVPEGELFDWPGRINVVRYGITQFSELFSARQLTAMCTFSDLVLEARKRVLTDALDAGIDEGPPLEDGGTGAAAYADAVATYLGFTVSKTTARNNTMCTWETGMDRLRGSFQRQAMPMTWGFAETNPLEAFGGGFPAVLQSEAEVLEALSWPRNTIQRVTQRSATEAPGLGLLISTDPPYYDNIGYSDLSDFFYVWLRRALRPVWRDLLGTMLVPKAEELVANPYRHSGNAGARQFFENGFTTVFERAREYASTDFPITVFYAFKQSESTSEGQASAGWETLLEGVVHSGWMITGTWPMRSELGNRMLARDTNALASSVVLALRPRGDQAPVVDRRGFISALQSELPGRLRELQEGLIAPVDLPQAAIGPGMAVFTRYGKVIESDGSAMDVRSALARINEVLDEVLSEQEGDFDATTRFAISWYRQHGYSAGAFGAADSMARARNTSVAAIERAGILTGRAGKVALLSPGGLSANYDPVADVDISVWEALHHLIRVLDSDGVAAAGDFMAQVRSRADGGIDPALVKELAFLLFSVADAKKWVVDAIAFNNVATSWSDLTDASRSGRQAPVPEQTLDYTTDDEEA